MVEVALSQCWKLDLECEECGRRRTWSVLRLQAVPRHWTTADLRRSLFCAECRISGGDGRNLNIRPSIRRSKQRIGSAFSA
jgi:hypothetical protein